MTSKELMHFSENAVGLDQLDQKCPGLGRGNGCEDRSCLNYKNEFPDITGANYPTHQENKHLASQHIYLGPMGFLSCHKRLKKRACSLTTCDIQTQLTLVKSINLTVRKSKPKINLNAEHFHNIYGTFVLIIDHMFCLILPLLHYERFRYGTSDYPAKASDP